MPVCSKLYVVIMMIMTMIIWTMKIMIRIMIIMIRTTMMMIRIIIIITILEMKSVVFSSNSSHLEYVQTWILTGWCFFASQSEAKFWKLLFSVITWLAVHCFSSVHCTQCIVQIQYTRESRRLRSPPPFLVNTVNRYFVTYAAMKYATFYWNNFIWLPVI